MYTRLLTFTGATGIDAGVDYLREEALPILEAQRGFRGVSASADRAGNLMSILSLWETEADRSASDSALGKAREEALKLVGGGLEIENFEETVQVITKPPVAGCVLNVVRVRMEPASIERNIAWFTESIVPTITAHGATAMMAAAACKAAAGAKCSTSWPPATAATIAAMLNQSHCWLTKVPLCWSW